MTSGNTSEGRSLWGGAWTKLLSSGPFSRARSALAQCASEPIEEVSKAAVCQSTQSFCVVARQSPAGPGKGGHIAPAL